MTRTTVQVPVQVECHGLVMEGTRELADAKVSSALRFVAEPVHCARVTLVVLPDPAVERPAAARVAVRLNGRMVRAQAVRETMRAAIEEMSARLETRLDRAARDWPAQRGGVPSGGPGEWRHQSVPAQRQPWFPRPEDDRAVIPRQVYSARPLTPDEAVAELELLDFDFHLFTERSTGELSVIYRSGGGYRLAQARPKPAWLGPLPASITLSEYAAARLTLAEAIGRLGSMGQQFVFYLDAGTGRAGLLYRRYDGHYGLVIPAG